jgi:enamine deaminase RidA (YjgF/YER057c/UK114 family)
MMRTVEPFQPAGVAEPLGHYSNASRAAGERLVFVAGQVGINADGSLAGDDLHTQAVQTFENIRTILASEGLDMSSIAKFTTYLVDASDIDAFYGVRDEVFPRLFSDGGYPPNTLLVVSRLVRPEFKVEIEAIAAASAGD